MDDSTKKHKIDPIFLIYNVIRKCPGYMLDQQAIKKLFTEEAVQKYPQDLWLITSSNDKPNLFRQALYFKNMVEFIKKKLFEVEVERPQYKSIFQDKYKNTRRWSDKVSFLKEYKNFFELFELNFDDELHKLIDSFIYDQNINESDPSILLDCMKTHKLNEEERHVLKIKSLFDLKKEQKEKIVLKNLVRLFVELENSNFISIKPILENIVKNLELYIENDKNQSEGIVITIIKAAVSLKEFDTIDKIIDLHGLLGSKFMINQVLFDNDFPEEKKKKWLETILKAYLPNLVVSKANEIDKFLGLLNDAKKSIEKIVAEILRDEKIDKPTKDKLKTLQIFEGSLEHLNINGFIKEKLKNIEILAECLKDNDIDSSIKGTIKEELKKESKHGYIFLVIDLINNGSYKKMKFFITFEKIILNSIQDFEDELTKIKVDEVQSKIDSTFYTSINNCFLDGQLQNKLNNKRDKYEEFCNRLNTFESMIKQLNQENKFQNLLQSLNKYQNNMHQRSIKTLELPKELDELLKEFQEYADFFKYTIFRSVLVESMKNSAKDGGTVNAKDYIPKVLKGTKNRIIQLIIDYPASITLGDFIKECRSPHVISFSNETLRKELPNLLKLSNNSINSENNVQESIEKAIQFFELLSRNYTFLHVEKKFCFISDLAGFYGFDKSKYNFFEVNKDRPINLIKNELENHISLVEKLETTLYEFSEKYTQFGEKKLIAELGKVAKNDLIAIVEEFQDPVTACTITTPFDNFDLNALKELKILEEELKNSNSQNFVKVFLDKAGELIKRDKNLTKKIVKFINNFDDLKRIFTTKVEDMVANRYMTLLTLESKSKIDIDSKILNNTLSVEFKIKGTGENEKIELKSDEIEELHLKLKMFPLKNSTQANAENTSSKVDPTQFKLIYKTMKKCAILARDLYDDGYNINLLLEKFKNDPQYNRFVISSDNFGINHICKALSKEKENWEKEKKNFLKKYLILNKIYGSELILIIEAIKNHIYGITVKSLIQVANPNLDLEKIKPEINKSQNWIDAVNDLGRFLDANQIHQDLHSDNIPTCQQINFNNKHILTIQTTMDKFTRVFIWTILKTCEKKKLPTFDNIFIFNNTFWKSSLETFLQRFLTEANTIFYLIIPENKNTQKNSNGIRYLNQFFLNISQNQPQIQPKGKLIVIHHEHLQTINIVEDSNISLLINPNLSEFNFKDVIAAMDSSKQKTVIYTSQSSGSGKSYLIKQQAKNRKIKYIELTIGGHTDFSKWSNRILDLTESCSPSDIIINLVIGWPENLEKKEYITHFQCQITLYIFMLIILRGYRCQFSNISFHNKQCENVNFSIEMLKSPGNLVQNNFEIFELFPMSELSAFSVEQLKIEIDDIDKHLTFIDKNKKYSKILELVHILEQFEMGKIKLGTFPAPGRTDNKKKQKDLIKKFFIENLKNNDLFPKEMTLSVLLYVIDLFFNEITDFNQCSVNHFSEFNEKLGGQPFSNIFYESRCEVLTEILNFCLMYAVSTTKVLLEKQNQVVDNYSKLMENITKDHDSKQQSKKSKLLVIFSKSNMVILFENTTLQDKLKKAQICFDYIQHLFNEPKKEEKKIIQI